MDNIFPPSFSPLPSFPSLHYDVMRLNLEKESQNERQAISEEKRYLHPLSLHLSFPPSLLPSIISISGRVNGHHYYSGPVTG